MNARKLANEVRSGIEWLIKQDCGCCHWPVGKGMAIALGWHDNGEDLVIAYKVGRITSLQCDFDVDFPMPYDGETGDVYDTCTTVVEDRKVPNAKDCYLIALDMNAAARGAKKSLSEGCILG